MGNILAIAGKEFRGYFASPIAAITIGLFTLLFGAFFYVVLNYFVGQSMQMAMQGFGGSLNVNQQMIRPILGNAAVVVLFLLPMITMRSFAEEKRSGTMELLLTSPLTDWQIILGKFLGAVGLYALMLLATAVNLAALYRFGNPEWKPILTGYLGLLLMGGSFLSIGLFLSSLTRNQIVAGVLTFSVALGLWIASWFKDTAGPLGREILTYISVIDHFEDFSKGVIDTKDLVYYLSFITLGLFLTAKSVDSERWRG
jgi:ABC-2 type transport system permease protein